MAANDKVFVSGRTFDLSKLVDVDGTAVQLSYIFQILQRQATEIQANRAQIEFLKSRFSEVDSLKQTTDGMLLTLDENAKQLKILDEGLLETKRASDQTQLRVTNLEHTTERIRPLEQRTMACETGIKNFKIEVEQLRVDSREALAFSSNISFFKNELSDLHEQVFQVLQQAPKTDSLMIQVRSMVENSSDQMKSFGEKTAYMEATMGRIMHQSKEVDDLRINISSRLEALENPKFDRVGSVENTIRDIFKQVKQLQHNWMSNWGAHEASMQGLRDELMVQMDQLRTNSEGSSLALQQVASANGSVTFIRMDEEDKKAFRKTLEHHGREISRLESKKADASLMASMLQEKAAANLLDLKMDIASFEDFRAYMLQKLDEVCFEGNRDTKQEDRTGQPILNLSSQSRSTRSAGYLSSESIEFGLTRMPGLEISGGSNRQLAKLRPGPMTLRVVAHATSEGSIGLRQIKGKSSSKRSMTPPVPLPPKIWIPSGNSRPSTAPQKAQTPPLILTAESRIQPEENPTFELTATPLRTGANALEYDDPNIAYYRSQTQSGVSGSSQK